VTPTREQIEQPIRDACSAGEHERAATLAIEAYGREVLGFLVARLDEQRGNEVFSDVLEDLWRGLPGFAWRSSLRSWLYTLARHAISRHLRGKSRRREAPLDTSAALSAVVERVRTDTAAYMRTPVKNRFRELRARLAEDEQTLLILRIDRNLSWRELASVMAEGEGPASDQDLDKVAARLRQRFQTAKDRLRKLAEDEGLLPSAEDEAQ
jgi:RNA polymerase sigma-70 factor (ECF subfamily)